jgi:hypothetical protein
VGRLPHIHLLVEVAGDPDPEIILKDFKAYASPEAELALEEIQPAKLGGPSPARNERSGHIKR